MCNFGDMNHLVIQFNLYWGTILHGIYVCFCSGISFQGYSYNKQDRDCFSRRWPGFVFSNLEPALLDCIPRRHAFQKSMFPEGTSLWDTWSQTRLTLKMGAARKASLEPKLWNFVYWPLCLFGWTKNAAALTTQSRAELSGQVSRRLDK